MLSGVAEASVQRCNLEAEYVREPCAARLSANVFFRELPVTRRLRVLQSKLVGDLYNT